MLFSTLTHLLSALAITVGLANATAAAGAGHGGATVQAKRFIAKETYTKHIALGALARISTFRGSRANLTAAQSDALDLMQHVVTTYDVDSVQAAEDACIAAFGRDECRYFATHHAADDASPLAARAPDCKCSTLNSWCDSKITCISHRTKACNYASYGCGTLWIYICDGRCAK